MKTFGLFMLLQALSILLIEWLLPDSVSQGERLIAGILEAWCMYYIIKEDEKK